MWLGVVHTDADFLQTNRLFVQTSRSAFVVIGVEHQLRDGLYNGIGNGRRQW